MCTQHRILALVYDEFEALDLWGPLGAIIPRSDYYTLNVVNIRDQSGSKGAVESSVKNSIGILPNLSWADALKEEEHFSTLFIPGGIGNRPLLNDPVLLQKIGQLVDRAASVFTVCTGSVVLAATGRLDGYKATTNKLAYDALTPSYPGVHWQKRARWVQDGKFLTSSGITAGIDAGLAFISNTYVAPEDRKAELAEGFATAIPGFDRQKALDHANHVARRLEYRWNSDPTDDSFAS